MTLYYSHAKAAKTANCLFILIALYLDLKLKCRDTVISKTPYFQWNLVKFITMLQHGLFVTRGTHNLSPERERSMVLLRYESKQKVC